MLKDTLLNLIPLDLIKRDSYKDSDNKGIYQRFMEALGDYFNKFESLAKSTQDTLNPLEAPQEFLKLLYAGLGENEVDEAFNRKLLSFLNIIHRNKGNLSSYEILCNFYNLCLIDIIIHRPSMTNYDDETEYDDDYQYDTLACDNRCFTYDLLVTYWYSVDSIENFGTLTQAEIDSIKKLICLVQPINGTLGDVIPTASLSEAYTVGILDTAEITITTLFTYDEDLPLEYDDVIEYDEGTTTIITI